MGRQVVGAETWKPNEDATSLPGGDTQFACSSAAYLRWERSRLWTIPWLWKQTSCFSVKSLPYLLKEQRLYSSLGQIFVFGIFTAYWLGACCSLLWFIWGPSENGVRMANFCLQEILPLWFYGWSAESARRIKFFYLLWLFFLLDKQRCWHWQWSLIFSHLTVP